MFTAIDPRQEGINTPIIDVNRHVNMIVSPPQGDTHIPTTRTYGSA